MMTNEELAEFEKENEFQFYKTMYVSYPEYNMIYMLKSPKTCAVNGIKDVTNENLHLDIPASVEIEGNTYWVNEIFEEGFWDNDYIEAVTIPDTALWRDSLTIPLKPIFPSLYVQAIKLLSVTSLKTSRVSRIW